jgi:RND family efflux transporter MFP subunit
MRLPVLPILVAATLTAGVGRADEPPKPKTAGYEFTGRTAPVAVVEVRARVSGFLKKVAVREGAEVKAGDVLIEIDPRLYQIELGAAKAKLTRAQTQSKVTTAELARVRELVQKEIEPAARLTEAQARADADKADTEVAAAETKLAELRLDWTQFRAPRAGRVSRVLIDEGNLVTADTTLVMTVVSIDTLYVVFDVDERTIVKLRRELGDAKDAKPRVEVGFASEEGFPHSATLESVGVVVDPATETVRVRATLSNPKGEFWSGARVRVRLTVQPGK